LDRRLIGSERQELNEFLVTIRTLSGRWWNRFHYLGRCRFRVRLAYAVVPRRQQAAGALK
jgi:hypothetical protein